MGIFYLLHRVSAWQRSFHAGQIYRRSETAKFYKDFLRLLTVALDYGVSHAIIFVFISLFCVHPMPPVTPAHSGDTLIKEPKCGKILNVAMR